MKRILFLALILTLSSCEKLEDLIYILDKVSYESYLNNETGQDLDIDLNPSASENTPSRYHLKSGQTLQIPDTDRWHLSQRTFEKDSVVIMLADGTRIVHCYFNPDYGKSNDKFIYTPEENNIFKVGITVPESDQSWTLDRIRSKKYRYDYQIR